MERDGGGDWRPPSKAIEPLGLTPGRMFDLLVVIFFFFFCIFGAARFRQPHSHQRKKTVCLSHLAGSRVVNMIRRAEMEHGREEIY